MKTTMTSITARRLTLLLLFCIVETILLSAEHFSPNLTLTPFLWIALIFAASLIGPAVAYLAIGDWLRWPFVKVVAHSSGVGEDTEPKYSEGPLNAIGTLLCCPICSATWAGVLLITLLSLNYQIGQLMIFAFGIGGAARLIIRASEAIEWQKNMLWEQTGYIHKLNDKQLYRFEVESMPGTAINKEEILEELEHGHNGRSHRKAEGPIDGIRYKSQ